MNLSEVNRGIEKHKEPRRLGRGIGSGQGKTAGRGHKGAGSRAGYSRKPTFQGGQMPLVRRIPKRGFHNKFALKIAVVNVSDLEENFTAGEEVNLETLKAKRLAQGVFDELKVLGNGEIKKKLKVSAHRFSQSALDKIKAAGGEAVVVPGRVPVVEKNGQAERLRAKKKLRQKQQ
jgi:large subunit ribosomal protein L15